jgi:hypothetical protein
MEERPSMAATIKTMAAKYTARGQRGWLSRGGTFIAKLP